MKNIRFLFIVVFLSGVVFNANAADVEGKMIKDALKAAEKWLSLVDAGKYEESWRAASSFAMDAVPKEKWVEAFENARNPLGLLKSRKVNKSQHLKTMRGAPDGNYVAVQYHSVFQKKESVIETLIASMDEKGHFRVMGYYVK